MERTWYGVKSVLLLILTTIFACKSASQSESKILSSDVQSVQDGSGPANAISASPSTLFEISSCIADDPEIFAGLAQELNRLRTQKRPGENANNCTGCSQAPCSICHAENMGGFFVPNLNKPWTASLKEVIRIDSDRNSGMPFTFAKTYFTQERSYYLPINKIKIKADVTSSGRPYGHPNFILPAEFNQALDAFTASIAKKVNAGLCKKP